MKQVITIAYDVLAQTVEIRENDFTNLEALGILEAAKVMIGDYWLSNSDVEEIEE